jgi:hypothetical protein
VPEPVGILPLALALLLVVPEPVPVLVVPELVPVLVVLVEVLPHVLPVVPVLVLAVVPVHILAVALGLQVSVVPCLTQF